MQMPPFTLVPVVEINKSNFTELWPSLLLSLKTAYFVALDLELSGLGERRTLNAKSVEERYTAMSEVAMSRAVISFGISCFKLQPKASLKSNETCIGSSQNDQNWRFLVQTFNILVLCNEPYTVEPGALQFLVEHHFDFNRQYALGIPYYRGHDKEEEKPTVSLRQLFVELLRNEKPLVLHNGFIDLIFLYQSFYCKLPKKFQSFITDLNDMFVNGIYDTKYIAEFRARMQASYLEYVFRKRQRENADKMQNGCVCVEISFLDYQQDAQHVDFRDCSLKASVYTGSRKQLCQSYANFGWCKNKGKCNFSHDIDEVLDAQMLSKTQKKKRKMMQKAEKDTSLESDGLSDNSPIHEDTSLVKFKVVEDTAVTRTSLSSAGCHRAGFDAFMTGFSFATFLSSYSQHPPTNTNVMKAKDLGLENLVNMIYLVGKNIPLLIATSNFSKCSSAHERKKSKIWFMDRI